MNKTLPVQTPLGEPTNSELDGLRAYSAMIRSPQYQNAQMQEHYTRNTNPEAVYFGNDPASGMTDAQYIQSIPKPQYLPIPKGADNTLSLDSIKNMQLQVQNAQAQGALDGQGNVQGQSRADILIDPNSGMFPTVTGNVSFKDAFKAKLESLSGGFLPKGVKLKSDGAEYTDGSSNYGVSGGDGGFKMRYQKTF
jgi:hypothetical protein